MLCLKYSDLNFEQLLTKKYFFLMNHRGRNYNLLMMYIEPYGMQNRQISIALLTD